MTAAVKTATLAGSTIGAGSSKSGTGLVFGIYTATKTDAADWVVFSDFSEVKGCIAINTDLDPITIDGTTKNKCTGSAGTGATTYWVWGVPVSN